VPITEVGSLAAGVGWCAACLAFLRLRPGGGRGYAMLGAVVSLGIVLMKVVPAIPGSFTRAEWIALAAWCALGLLAWLVRRPVADTAS